MSYSRFGVYYLPEPPLASFGAAWLGWDVCGGAVAAPDVPGLTVEEIRDITATPRKYGLHATLKPPFRLAEGTDAGALERAFDEIAAGIAPAEAPALRLARLGGFLALVPEGEAAGIARVAGACVERFDAFRAPAPEAELARRRASGLSDRQEAMLTLWGYPYVFEEFRFHITLTGKLPEPQAERVEAALAGALPPLPAPFRLDRISLVGETPEGFRLIRHAALTG